MEEPSRQKKHIITIAGKPGSGKSTAAKAIAVQLGYKHLSGGDLYRAAGRERGLDVLQANIANEKTGEIDMLVDSKLEEIETNDDRYVIDSRTAWHFIPSSFKVFLDLDLEVAASRILSTMEEARIKHENVPSDPKLYAKELQSRLESEMRRYKGLYSIEPFDMRNYDLVIDTKNTTKEGVAERIIKAYQEWAKA